MKLNLKSKTNINKFNFFSPCHIRLENETWQELALRDKQAGSEQNKLTVKLAQHPLPVNYVHGFLEDERRPFLNTVQRLIYMKIRHLSTYSVWNLYLVIS